MKKLMFTLCVIAFIGLFSACEAENINDNEKIELIDKDEIENPRDK